MLKITIQPFIREEMNMKLAIVDDNPEELQKFCKTFYKKSDYPHKHYIYLKIIKQNLFILPRIYYV